MIHQRQIQVSIFIASFIYIVGLLWIDLPARDVVLRLSGFAVSAVSISLLLWDRYLWKLSFVRRFVPKPFLHGTWKGTFKSNYINPETGTELGPVEAYFAMTQTYSSLHVRFITAESTSDSIACEIRSKADKRHVVYAIYENIPLASLRERSPIHRGGLVLDVIGSPATDLKGTYWTDRLTKGDLYFDKCSDTVYSSFERAKSGTYI